MPNPLNSTFGGTGRSAILSNRATSESEKLMTLSISGTFDATVTLDRSFDGGDTWHIVESYTIPVEKNISTPSDYFIYSLNCPTYVSGTVTYFMSK